MIYTVTLNPSLDYVMHTPTLKTGLTNRSQGEEMYVGGKGINVSLVLKQFRQRRLLLHEENSKYRVAYYIYFNNYGSAHRCTYS